MRRNTLNSQNRVRGPVKLTEVGHDLEGSGRNIRDHTRKTTTLLLLKKVPGEGGGESFKFGDQRSAMPHDPTKKRKRPRGSSTERRLCRYAAARRCLGTMCPALARLGDRGDSRESAEPRHHTHT